MSFPTEAQLAEELRVRQAQSAELKQLRAELAEARSARHDAENRLRTLFDFAPEAIVMLDAETGRFIDVNPKAEQIFCLSARALSNVGPFELSPPLQPGGRPSLETGLEYVRNALDGGRPVFEWWHQNAKGEQFPCEVHLVRIPWGERPVLRGSITEISVRKRLELSERGRSQVLERIAKGDSLEEVLDTLVKTVEELLPGMICSVLLLDQETNCLGHGIGPSLPSVYNEAVNGLKIGIGVGSCGTAAHTGKRVVVADVTKHPYWANYQELLKLVDFRACWSQPIMSLNSNVLGTFAMYYREPRDPTQLESEIIEFAAQLAAIAIEHDQTQQILQDINKSLERSVAERTRDLAAANAALIRSNDELRQFAYVASHDLQEPLRMVTAFGQLLRSKLANRLDSEEQEWLGYVIEGGIRMQDLVNDLLDYSRIESQARPFQNVELRDAVSTAVTNLRQSIKDTGAKITLDQLPTVVADGPQIVQLLQNLISNGIKFHDQPPPRIHVTAEQRDKDWLISVRDHGIGIEPRYLECIFDFFKRVHSRDRFPGTGIGLPICKRVVERHGGRIWVESTPGQGSEFFFTLPLGTLS